MQNTFYFIYFYVELNPLK